MTYRSGSLAILLSLSFFPAINASRSEAGEILHYSFDQVDGAGPFTTSDASGRGNTGTLTAMDSANLVPGLVGNALKFEGGTTSATRDRVEVLTTDVATLTDFNRAYTQFTFAAFLMPAGIAAEEPDTTFIAGKLGTGSNRGWQLGLVGTDTPTFAHPDEFVVSLFEGPASTDKTNEFYSGPTAALADSKWVHVAFTFSGTDEPSSFFRMYINGEKVVDATTDLFQMNGVNSRAFQVGNRGDSRADSWSGLIDEVHMYDHALTDEEVLALIPPVLNLKGDFDDDRDVDGNDFLLWQQTFGDTVAAGTEADDDLSGVIDAGDLEVWKATFGQSIAETPIPSAGAAAVPEPAALPLLAAACIGLGRLRGKARRLTAS